MSSTESDPLAAKNTRLVTSLRWTAWLALLAGLVLVLSALPVGDLVGRLQTLIGDLGAWGYLLFFGIYVLATVLMLPASAVTLVAGAVFGLWRGTAAVSVSSVTGAACAFLISRYLARDKFAAKIGRYPKFAAIDHAIAEGGWKIVALLRLSPAVPFNFQNYLYGLTKIRFWPCVLTSWIAMLPGTFMYVYFGYLAGATVGAAQEGQAETGSQIALKWTIRIVGVLATIAVTLYVTKLAKAQLAKQTDIDAEGNEEDPQAAEGTADGASPKRVPWILLVVGAIVLAAGIVVYVQKDAVRSAIHSALDAPGASTEAR